MENQENWPQRLRLFMEASSLMAHDVSGQAHVAQFCADELFHKYSEDPSAQKFLGRLLESLDELSELVLTFRQFLKDQAPEQLNQDVHVIHQVCLKTLELYYFKERQLINFNVDPKLQGLLYHGPALELQGILYALYSVAIENMRQSKVSSARFSLQRVNEPQEQEYIFFKEETDQFTKEAFDQLVQSESFLSAGSYRRSCGLVDLKKALQGKLEAVKIDFDDRDNSGVRLILK